MSIMPPIGGGGGTYYLSAVVGVNLRSSLILYVCERKKERKQVNIIKNVSTFLFLA